MNFEVLKIAQALIKCPSITPLEAGGLDILEDYLKALGFICHRLPFENVDNLYARRGTKGTNLCFLGHMDVVPSGDALAWHHDPFEGIVENQRLYGRGAVDMKGAIAAFVAALSQTPASSENSISLLITCDEEGPALHGTRQVLQELQKRHEKIDFCIVGEPTSEQFTGDTLKIGRRGSLSGTLTVSGKQGHIAYPEHFDNPVPVLMKILMTLYQDPLDKGMKGFSPSHFEVLTVDVGNTVSNIIPAKAIAHFNIRFNPLHTEESLKQYLHRVCQDSAKDYQLDLKISAHPFLTSSLEFAEKIQTLVEGVTHQRVHFSTSGGTSDARFIHSLCPVVEIGLKNATAHQVDEYVDLKDLRDLVGIYKVMIEKAGS